MAVCRHTEEFMERTTTIIPQEDIQAQLAHCQAVAQLTAQWPERPLAFVDTYGCPNIRV
jgi:hypothetical protein